MAKKQGVRDMRVYFETDAGNYSRTDIHWMDRVAQGIAQVQNATFVVEFYDDNGHRARRIEFGEPSPELLKLMDEDDALDQVVGA